MQPMKLMMLGNKVLPLHSGAKYKWIYRTYIAVTGDNMVLTMGEILVKKDFSGTADATPQRRTDFSSRLVYVKQGIYSEVCDCDRNVF